MERKKRTSNEFMDSTGSDAALHAELLDNPGADLACRISSTKRLLNKGSSEEVVRKLYSLPEDFVFNADD